MQFTIFTASYAIIKLLTPCSRADCSPHRTPSKRSLHLKENKQKIINQIHKHEKQKVKAYVVNNLWSLLLGKAENEVEGWILSDVVISKSLVVI
jgi:hypothetical protein